MENNTKKYSPATGGFYDPAIHGDGIPEDAVEVLDEEYSALFDAQAAGKIIVADENGRPVAVDRPPLTGNALILAQIANLEASITPRRMRESVLGVDGGWLKRVDDQIANLRGSLK